MRSRGLEQVSRGAARSAVGGGLRVTAALDTVVDRPTVAPENERFILRSHRFGECRSNVLGGCEKTSGDTRLRFDGCVLLARDDRRPREKTKHEAPGRAALHGNYLTARDG